MHGLHLALVAWLIMSLAGVAAFQDPSACVPSEPVSVLHPKP